MADSPNLEFSVKNKSIPTTPGAQIVHYVQGITTRGKANDPSELIRSWPQFLKAYGGYRTDTAFPRLCKRLLDRGSYLRVSRVMHYTDITDSGTLDASMASAIRNEATISFNQTFVVGEKIYVNIDGVKKIYTVILADPTEMYNHLAKLLKNDFPSIIGVTTDPINNALTLYFNNAYATLFSVDVKSGAGLTVSYSQQTSSGDVADITGSYNPLFSVVLLNPGADGNHVSVTIAPASNGNPDYFNLVVNHAQDSYMNEIYENLIINEASTPDNATYFDVINLNSNLIHIDYNDLSGTSLADFPLIPEQAHITFMGGDDGTPPTVIDYLGDPNSKTGVYAFNEYDDGYTISAPDFRNQQFASGLDGYVGMRKDLVAYHGTPVSPNYTTEGYLAYMEATNIDNKLSVFTGGGIIDTNQITGKKESITELADALGCLSHTFNNEKPWFSAFGPQRGQIPNALGVVNNYGPTSKYPELNVLSQNGLNMAIRRDNKIFMQNNVTARKTPDIEQNLNVIILELYIMKTLRPLLEPFLDEPNDIPTWQRMYYTCKPFLDKLYTERAIYQPAIWNGDQDASSLNDLQINDPVEVQNGNYRIELEISPIPGMRKIKVELILTTAGVSFNFI